MTDSYHQNGKRKDKKKNNKKKALEGYFGGKKNGWQTLGKMGADGQKGLRNLFDVKNWRTIAWRRDEQEGRRKWIKQELGFQVLRPCSVLFGHRQSLPNSPDHRQVRPTDHVRVPICGPEYLAPQEGIRF